ncbi:MAG: hypothetical protein IKY90_07145 [Oscillospiraceae bacterium]|nr:hypothetical protein [Oscillospiraceae bacterium]
MKENKIDIPGGDGSIDLTDFFGEPKYEDVQHKFEFTTIEPQSDFLSQYSQVKNAIHGKKVRIILDDDPTFFYLGRCHVSSFTSSKGIGTISVECDCEPYKYKLNKTVVTRTVSGTADITLTNSRKRAVPEITTSAAMTFVFGDGSWTKAAGTFTIPELELFAGANNVTVTGTGSVTFTWQEGDL